MFFSVCLSRSDLHFFLPRVLTWILLPSFCQEEGMCTFFFRSVACHHGITSPVRWSMLSKNS